MNDLIRPAMYDAHHDIVSVTEAASTVRYDVVGPVCESSDMFARDCALPELKAGDLVAIMTAGAYGAVMSSAYNARPPAPEVLVNAGAWSVVRPRMSIDALVQQDRLRPGSRADESERYVSVARLAILWERLWRASWPATGILGLFVAAALFGAFEFMPQGLHRDLLFLVVFATGAFLHRNLKDFALPRWEDGARRVERDSRLVHRPITESQDRLAVGMGDAAAEELWSAHLRRLLARIENLRVRLPSPGLQSRDPHAARFAVLLLLIAGAVVAGREAPKRLALAFTPDAGTNSSTASLDAWINPPAYTGQAPVYLQHPVDSDAPIAVPAGSQLVLRVHAAHGLPNLALEPEPGDAPVKFAGSSGEYGVDVPLAGDGAVRVISDGKLLARFQVHAIPDRPPTIAFAGVPSETERDALKIAFTAADDYGVVSARAIIRPKTAGARGALSIDLPLSASSARTLTQTVYRDLTGEPLAGLDVDMVLEARDGAGQLGTSRHLTVHLPARVFTSPWRAP